MGNLIKMDDLGGKPTISGNPHMEILLQHLRKIRKPFPPDTGELFEVEPATSHPVPSFFPGVFLLLNFRGWYACINSTMNVDMCIPHFYCVFFTSYWKLFSFNGLNKRCFVVENSDSWDPTLYERLRLLRGPPIFPSQAALAWQLALSEASSWNLWGVEARRWRSSHFLYFFVEIFLVLANVDGEMGWGSSWFI